MTNGAIDELRKGNWMELPRADGSLGHILYREGFRAVVIPSDKGDYPWESHIGESMSGVADTPAGGMQEVGMPLKPRVKKPTCKVWWG